MTINAASTYYQDADGDGYGNPTVSVSECSAPVGYVTNNTDCNDSNLAVNPVAAEVCTNTIDDNCNTLINENCCTLSLSAVTVNTTCTGLSTGSIDLTVSGATAPTYVWSNGATTQDIANLSAGNYSVIVTDNGCTQNGSYTVGNNNQVQAAPTSINGPAGVCRNSTGNVFTTPAVVGATAYQWTLPTGASGSSTTNSITLSFNSTYVTGNLSVRAVGPCGTSAAFTQSVVAITAVPSAPASISGPTVNVCGNTTQTYSCPAVTGAVSYQWTAPANSSITSGQGTQTITISFANNFGANGTISVRAQNCVGLSTARTITVYRVPGTPGTISGATNNVCAGSVLTYAIAAVPGATGYTWTAPTNTTIASGQGTTSISLTVGASFTSGTLSVVATSSCGQSTARSLGLSRNPPTPSTISGPTANLCGGGQFTYSISPVSGAVSYNWTVPSGCSIVTNSGTSIVMNVPSTFTTGTLSVAAVNICGVSSSRSASLTRLPATPASISGPTSVCPNQVGVVFSTPAITGVTHTWSVPNSATITAGQGTTTMTCNWGSNGTSVSVRNNNACGQSASLSRSVTLAACIEEQSQMPDEVRVSSVDVYPNPNSGSFTVHASQPGSFKLVNSTGQLIQEIRLNDTNNFSIEINNLSTGFYFLQGVAGAEYIVQKIVVVNR
jgi:hypothetical protein